MKVWIPHPHRRHQTDDAKIISSWVCLEDFQYKFVQASARLVKKGGSSQVVIGVVSGIESPMIKSANRAQENRENLIVRVKNDQCVCTLFGIKQAL